MQRIILHVALIGLFVAIGMQSPACFADAWYCRPETANEFCIAKNITRQDAAFVRNFADRYSKTHADNPRARPFVTLDSGGGDVLAAIEIGRVLRGLRAFAIIPEPSKCLSACVFVLAGATTRGSFGKIGIHRPYSVETRELSYAEAQERNRAFQSVAKGYLEEMSMPARLYDLMASIPPDQMRILSEEEVSILGLGGSDPAEQDIHDAEEARKYGISKQELYSRRTRHFIICQKAWEEFQASPDLTRAGEYLSCQETVMRGKR